MKGARTEDQIYGEFGEDSGSYENEESEKDDDLEPTPYIQADPVSERNSCDEEKKELG